MSAKGWSESGSGELEPEGAAFARLGFDTAGPTHPLHGPRDDRQADARALIRSGRQSALKNSKDFLMGRGRDADSLVSYPNANEGGQVFLSGRQGKQFWLMIDRTKGQRPGARVWGAVFNDFGGNGDFWGSSGMNKFDGIINEVGEDVLQQAWMAADRMQRSLDIERFVDSRGTNDFKVVDDRLNSDRVEGDFLARNFAELEEIAGESLHAFGSTDDSSDQKA